MADAVFCCNSVSNGSSLEPNWEDIQIVMIFSFAVLFVSYLVIYSIFYIYVHNQVREFGQLRTMGTTAKQIKKILRVQGRIFCVYGTALGLVIGGIADYIYDWTFHVGDTVKFRWFDGIREQETEFRIAGEISDGRLSNRNILKWKQFTLKLLNIWVISATFGG